MPSVLDLIQRLLRKCCNAIEASGLSSLLDATCRVCDVYLRSSNEVRHRDANARSLSLPRPPLRSGSMLLFCLAVGTVAVAAASCARQQTVWRAATDA